MFYSRGSRRSTRDVRRRLLLRLRRSTEKVSCGERELPETPRPIDGSGLKCAALTAAACKQRHTCHSASVCLLRRGWRCGVSRPRLSRNQTERGVFKDNLTLCNHSCLGFDHREGRGEIITRFWAPFLHRMKGDVRFESYVNGRLSVRMWWGGVECYLREIKQDPLRHFVLPALRASGNLSRAASTEHGGGVTKTAWGLTPSSPRCTLWKGRTLWLTDWPTTLHFKVPPLICAMVGLENCFYFCAGPFHEYLSVIYVITEQAENGIRVPFCGHCYFPFIYQYESPRHQVAWSSGGDVLILTKWIRAHDARFKRSRPRDVEKGKMSGQWELGL